MALAGEAGRETLAMHLHVKSALHHLLLVLVAVPLAGCSGDIEEPEADTNLSAVSESPKRLSRLFGTVYSKGAPVANLAVQVKGTSLMVRTGPHGEYAFDVHPGDHVLVVRAREIAVSVGADPTRADVHLY